MLQEKKAVHSMVREHYASRAQESSACCDSEARYYSLEEVETISSEVAGFSLGCGNAVSAADLRPGETVVDLGSGGGLEVFIAARQVGDQGRAVGIDMTPEMLSRARQSAERMGFTNVEFLEGLIESVPMTDGSADVIISNCVINLSPDKPAVLAEMWRLLKPGGRIAISDVVTKGEISEDLKSNMELWSACASGALPVAEWEAGLRTLGFTEIRIVANEEEHDWLDNFKEGTPFSAIISATKPG